MAVPADATLEWVADVVAPGARLVDAGPLAERTSPWWVCIESAAGPTTVVVRAGVDGDESRCLIEIERAALQAAGDADVAAARFVAADPSGVMASQPALVSTLVAGSSDVPLTATTERLRALGRAVGTLAACGPPEGLPRRTRPLEDVDFYAMWRESAGAVRARWRARAAGEPWTAALQVLDEHHPTAAPDALVHGDCWQGNSLWVDGEFRGFVDWDAAGAGPPGIDLGTMRLDVAFFFGADAMDDVATGWAETSGRPVVDLAYWDLVAAITSPIDLGQWLPNLQRLGRPDLDAATMGARREESVRRALAAI
jgi:aminoglycoside phosphotransferase (APT) family kinase protein